jgi:Arc/MetJ-type ribon-helix-helix transcriptional regulator
MDVLTVRLDNNVSKKIDILLKEFNYSTKTEFVREAIRAKVSEMEDERSRKKVIKSLEEGFGSFRGKALLTDKEFEAKRDQIAEEFVKEVETKYKKK